jgi:predicted nuclease of predicted toxin-antitoxin system
MKFLIDECLSPNIVTVANDRGFEAYHVAHRGWGGCTDRRLLQHLLEEELVLVTNNRDDFLDLVSGVELHPGLLVILPNVRRAGQIALFGRGLEAVSKMTSLVNKVVDIHAGGLVRVSEVPNLG